MMKCRHIAIILVSCSAGFLTSCAEIPRLLESTMACSASDEEKWGLVEVGSFQLRVTSECGRNVGTTEWLQRPILLQDTLPGGQGYLFSRTAFPLTAQLRDYRGTRLGGNIPLKFIPSGARVSPDARTIALVDGHRALSEQRDAELILLQINDLSERRLLTLRLDNGLHYDFSWSPNSEEVIVSDAGTISAVRVSDGQKRIIAEGSGGRWSPNGKWFAFVNPHKELIIVAAGSAEKLTPAPRREFIGSCLEWSPDSTLLASCELASPQPDPKHRVLSFLGVYSMTERRYRKLAQTTWGGRPALRWVRMESGGVAALEKMRSDFSLDR